LAFETDMGWFFIRSGQIQLTILALKGWSWSLPKPKRAYKNAWLSPWPGAQRAVRAKGWID
jgi:hypothetical protein